MFTLVCNRYHLELGARTHIMGIVNVTPDSFSDGGHFFNTDDAVARGVRLVEDGADIIDIGGESTRPFSDALPAEEELKRVLPVIEKLAARISVPISIDTTKSIVARQAVAAGASIINDISAFRLDPDMAATVAESGVPVVLMHMQGIPKTMQAAPVYEDLVGEVSRFLADAIDTAAKNGILKSRLVIDPGIGFGKTFRHNLILLNHLDELKALNMPILVGPSRKAFIRNLLKDNAGEELPPDHPRVETGTQAAVAAAVLNGAHIVRVHDVARTRATLDIIDAVKNAHRETARHNEPSPRSGPL